MTNLAAWTHWANARNSHTPLPGPYPTRDFLQSLRSGGADLHSEGTLVRISTAASRAAENGAGPLELAAWLMAVIYAHHNWNAENGQGSYGWTDTHASDAMAALAPLTLQPPLN